MHDVDAVTPRHESEEALIAYVDGELSAAESETTRAHLESCWECRSRLNAIEGSIEAFLRVRRSLLPPDIPPSHVSNTVFRDRLAQHIRERGLEAPRFHHAFAKVRARIQSALWPPVLAQRSVFALVALVGVVGIIITASLSTTLSANEVLARAEVREFFDIRLADDVVQSSVRIEQTDSSTSKTLRHVGSIDITRDFASSAASLSLRSASGTVETRLSWHEDDWYQRIPFRVSFGDPLVRYFEAQHWFPEVSVAGYRKLIAGRGLDTSNVVRRGAFVELRHVFAPGHGSGIAETLLVLEHSTYQARQISIYVWDGAGRSEYGFLRTALSFVPRSPALAALFAEAKAVYFADTAPRMAVNRPTPASVPLRRPLPLSYTNSLATDAEVAVAVALHQTGACLGEEINVFQMSDASLLVQGLVDSADRKNAVAEKLAGAASRLRIEIFTPSELNTGAELLDAPDRQAELSSPPLRMQSQIVRLNDLSGAKVLAYDHLQKYFLRNDARSLPASREELERRIAAFANEMVTQSREGLFHAWALKRLDAEFSDQRIKRLTKPSLDSIQQLRRTHRETIAKLSRQLAVSLGQVLPENVQHGGESPRLSPSRSSATIFRQVSEQDELVRTLFVTTAGTTSNADADLAKLMTLLQLLGSET